MLLDFVDFAWLEQPEGNLMDALSRIWCNGSYTIAAKPIKTLELHYTMIQFLINLHILSPRWKLCERKVTQYKRTVFLCYFLSKNFSVATAEISLHQLVYTIVCSWLSILTRRGH